MIILSLIGASVAGYMLYRGFASGSGGGWQVDEDGADLTAAMRSFLDKLAAAVGFPIVVTSGIRTPESQVSALRGKLAAGNSFDDLRKLYGNSSAINELLAASQSSWVSVLKSQMARGVYLSPHMRADAVDIRTHGLSSSQKTTVINAARAIGASSVIHEDEGTSNEHIHITIGGLTGVVSNTLAPSTWSWGQLIATGFMVFAGAAAVAVGTAGAVGYWGYKKARARWKSRKNPRRKRNS